MRINMNQRQLNMIIDGRIVYAILCLCPMPSMSLVFSFCFCLNWMVLPVVFSFAYAENPSQGLFTFLGSKFHRENAKVNQHMDPAFSNWTASSELGMPQNNFWDGVVSHWGPEKSSFRFANASANLYSHI